MYKYISILNKGEVDKGGILKSVFEIFFEIFFSLTKEPNVLA